MSKIQNTATGQIVHEEMEQLLGISTKEIRISIGG